MDAPQWTDLRRRLHALEDVELRIPEHHTRAAVSLCLAPGAKGLELLLMKRVEHPDDPWSGQISLPGGHEEPEDSSLSMTARRETLEEVGVDLGPDAPGCPMELGLLDPVQARARGGLMDTTIVPFVHALTEPPPTHLGPEAAETLWLPLEVTRSGALEACFPYSHTDGRVHDLPCWEFEGSRIWGLTYRIVSDLLRVLATPEGA